MSHGVENSLLWLWGMGISDAILISSDFGYVCYICPPTGGWTYYFLLFPASAIQRPPSIVTLGFRSFQGKVFVLSLPNLVWVFIGLIGIASGENSSIAE